MPQIMPKGATEVLDYKFDWSDWLAEGETVNTCTVAADTGLTVDSDSITDTNTTVTVWLSGGVAGQKYKVTCTVVTSAARTGMRYMTIRMRK